MADLFGYTQTNNVRVDTKPQMINQRPDMRAAKAFNDVIGIMQGASDIYAGIKKDRNEKSALGAADEANQVHSWYSQEVAKTQDPYAQYSLLQQYKTALASIEEGYQLEDKYKTSFQNSNKAFVNEQERVVGARVTKQQIQDTDDGLANFAAANAGASATEIASVLKDAKGAYKQFGVSDEETSNKLFGIFFDAKVAAFNADPMTSNFKLLENDVNEFVKELDPKLTNKEVHKKAISVLKQLQTTQKGLINEHMGNLLDSEKTTKAEFDREADSYKHVLSDLEISNLKEKKANNVYDLKVREQTRIEAQESNAPAIFKKNMEATFKDPYATEETIKGFLQTAQNIGYYSEIQANSRFNQWKEDKTTKQTTKDNALIAEQKKIANGEIAKVKASSTTKDGMSPEMLGNYMLIADGGILKKENIEYITNYVSQYNIENSAKNTKELINKTSNAYTGIPGEKGFVNALTNIVNSFFKDDQFSADGILKIYNNHGIKGDLPKMFQASIKNPENVPTAVNKVKQMLEVNRTATLQLLGDKFVAQVEALGNRLKQETDKNGNVTKVYIDPNDVKNIETIVNDKSTVKVDRSLWDYEVKQDPRLAQFGDTFENVAKLDPNAVEQFIADKKALLDAQYPVPNVNLVGYNGAPLTEDDKAILKDIPAYLSNASKDIIGFSFNPADGYFYYSKPGDEFAAAIVGDNGQPFTNLNGVDGLVNFLQEKKYNYYNDNNRENYRNMPKGEQARQQLGEAVDIVTSKTKALSDALLDLNPKQTDWTVWGALKKNTSFDSKAFDNTNTGKFINFIKERFTNSGLQAAELPKGDGYNIKEDNRPIEAIKDEILQQLNAQSSSNEVVEGVVANLSDKKTIEGLQQYAGVKATGKIDATTADALTTKLEKDGAIYVYESSTKVPADLYLRGDKAINQLAKDIGRPLTAIEKDIVKEEGYVKAFYKDTEGVTTYGVGQTKDYIYKSPVDVIAEKTKATKKIFPGFDKYPEDIQVTLVNAMYRGDVISKKTGKPYKWANLLKQGDIMGAAFEFMDNQDYRKAVAQKTGIKTRFETNAKRLMAGALGFKYDEKNKQLDRLLEQIK